MNYNAVFAPTTRIERFLKSHTANLPAYARIALVLVLAAASAVLNFVSDQHDRIPEYQIRYQLAVINTKRFFVRMAITTEKTRLAINPKLTAALDKVFCLN